MTARSFRLPVLIATAVLLYAWLLTQVPFGVSLGLRGANGFLMIVLIIWHNQRVRIELSEIREFLRASETSKHAAIEALADRADRIAEALAVATGERQTELVAKIEEGTEASREAQREANSVNKKIADLDQRLLDSIPPKAQIDDIQATGHESREILGVIVEKKPEPT